MPSFFGLCEVRGTVFTGAFLVVGSDVFELYAEEDELDDKLYEEQ